MFIHLYDMYITVTLSLMFAASNVMLVGQKIKLIDLDASANISRGDFAGSKYSSGYVPPELIYESEPLSVQSPSSRSRPTSIAPSIDQSTAALLSHCQYGVRTFSIDPFGNPITTSSTHYDLVKAAVGIDMWTLGALLYFLCTGSPLFQLTVEDNIFKSDDLRLLYYWDDAFAYTLFEQVTDRYARNLISTLLNKDPSRRPDSSRVLTHPFLTGRPCARLIGEVAAYDVFLSYRVNSDAEHANRIYKSLTERGVKVWFDKKCIQPGTDWEESFIDGLLNSSCFVCLLSRNALTPVAEMTETSRADNVLLEWMLALELLERGYLSNIFPVMIGDQTTPATAINADITSVSDSSSSNTTSFNSDIEYSDYFPSGCHGSNYPTFIHPATLSKLQSHLQRQGLGQTYVNESSFAVQSVLTEMVKRQGAFIRGDWRSSVRLLVNDILSIKRARSNKVTTNTANNLDTSPSYQLSDPAADENLPEQVLGQRAESMSPPTPISPQVSHSNIANGPASRVIASPLLVENRIDNRNYTPVPTDETESIVPSTANEEERPRAATFAIEGPIE